MTDEKEKKNLYIVYQWDQVFVYEILTTRFRLSFSTNQNLVCKNIAYVS